MCVVGGGEGDSVVSNTAKRINRMKLGRRFEFRNYGVRTLSCRKRKTLEWHEESKISRRSIW